MKIAFVLTVGLDRPSGIRYAGLARGLAALGHDVTVFALHPDFQNLTPRRFRWEGIDVCYVGQMHARKVGSRPGRFGPLQLLAVIVRSTLALTSALMQADVDCFHLGKPQPINGMAAMLANRRRRRPLYLDCDDYEAGSNRFSNEWQRRVFAWWEDKLPGWAEGVTVNTPFLAQRVAQLGVPREWIIYVPNGVDLHEFRPQPQPYLEALRRSIGVAERRVIAYAGTLSLHNHPVDLLLDALPEVLRREPDVVALLIGGGEDLDHLRRETASRGLTEAVRFTGHVPRPLLRALLSLAELSVDPVYDDPVARARSPLKIFESLALGVPVVTGEVGDRVRLLAEGRAGVLVRAGTPLAIAHGITGLLGDKQSLTAMRVSAREHVRAYDWKRLAEHFQTVYH